MWWDRSIQNPIISLTLCLHSALMKQASAGSHKETEKKAAVKHVAAEQKTSHRSQAHLLAGAVKRRRYSLFIYNHKADDTTGLIYNDKMHLLFLKKKRNS